MQTEWTRRVNATATSPQVVVFVVDDSGSMGESNKALQATEALQNLLLELQQRNQQSTGFRYLLSIAKFGATVSPLVTAEPPEAIGVTSLSFTGSSGDTNMKVALEWASTATTTALAKTRNVPGYSEKNAPTPIVLFFSDGANTGDPVDSAAKALKSIAFDAGHIDVIAVGIGMLDKDFPTMELIASQPHLAVNINPAQLSQFIADAGQTMLNNKSAAQLAELYSS